MSRENSTDKIKYTNMVPFSPLFDRIQELSFKLGEEQGLTGMLTDKELGALHGGKLAARIHY